MGIQVRKRGTCSHFLFVLCIGKRMSTSSLEPVCRWDFDLLVQKTWQPLTA